MHKSLFVLAAAALAACGSPTDSRPAVRLATSDSTFVRAPSPAVASVSFSVANGGAATVYLPACNGEVVPDVESETGTSWTHYAGALCLMIYSSAPVALAPGATAQGALSLPEPGRYRLRLGVSTSLSARSDLTVVSPPFTVR